MRPESAAWLLLLLAGFAEVLWVLGLKTGVGVHRPWLTAGTIAAMIASVVLLAVAMRTLPMGTAYAVWTGIGTTGAVLAGIVWYGEAVTVARLLCIAAIVIGITGLKLTGSAS